jgi:hypothetical protein
MLTIESGHASAGGQADASWSYPPPQGAEFLESKEVKITSAPLEKAGRLLKVVNPLPGDRSRHLKRTYARHSGGSASSAQVALRSLCVQQRRGRYERTSHRTGSSKRKIPARGTRPGNLRV